MGKIILVAGARPNFVKLAPLCEQFAKMDLDSLVVHTGQHYDHNMSQLFFEELNIPKPDINLGVGSSSHAQQTAEIMISFEKVCNDESPSLVVVFGDINSTIACALVAKKLGIQVAHVEAGLRSRDVGMPEEINRILTDHISDYLFTTTKYANENLENEGINRDKIFFVGNIMIDTLKKQLSHIKKSKIMHELGVKSKNFHLLTLHRPSNVDDEDNLVEILEQFRSPEFNCPVVFPVHPRTRNRIIDNKSIDVDSIGLNLIHPLGYNDFLNLQLNALSVWTDSGGIQEETTYLGVPCFTIRENTERPETIYLGTNTLVPDRTTPYTNYLKTINTKSDLPEIPLWDGNTGYRISKIIQKELKIR